MGCKILNMATLPRSRHFQGRLVILSLTLDIAYKCTKFYDSSFSHSRDRLFEGVWNLKLGHVTLTTFFWGTVCCQQAETCYGKPTRQIWALNFTRYRNIKSDAKCRKWGGLGWLGVTQAYRQCHHAFDRAHTTSYSSLIETLRLFCTVKRYNLRQV